MMHNRSFFAHRMHNIEQDTNDDSVTIDMQCINHSEEDESLTEINNFIAIGLLDLDTVTSEKTPSNQNKLTGAKKVVSLFHLPPELIVHILSFSTPKTLANFSCLNRIAHDYINQLEFYTLYQRCYKLNKEKDTIYQIENWLHLIPFTFVGLGTPLSVSTLMYQRDHVLFLSIMGGLFSLPFGIFIAALMATGLSLCIYPEQRKFEGHYQYIQRQTEQLSQEEKTIQEKITTQRDTLFYIKLPHPVSDNIVSSNIQSNQ